MMVLWILLAFILGGVATFLWATLTHSGLRAQVKLEELIDDPKRRAR